MSGEGVAEWFASRASEWAGSVVLALGDVPLTYVLVAHAELCDRFLLGRTDPKVLGAMLDKQRTVEMATEAGISVPRQWAVTDEQDVERILEAVVFPALVKPKRTYELVRARGHKFLWARKPSELRDAVVSVLGLPGGISVIEFVPGPDHRLSSYNALRHEGQVLGEYTKRIVRRYPTNEGGATLHQMCRDERAIALGRRFFDHIGLEGFGNVEFKLDERDGQLKLIECNYRLTAAVELAERSGIELVWAVYRQALGAPEPFGEPTSFPWYWYPANDLRSAAGLGPAAVADWLSMPLRRPVLPYFSAGEPGPSFQHWANGVRGVLSRRLPRARH
jgi:predicted ATP-grasp superfamily ATP-dependent carboligase